MIKQVIAMRTDLNMRKGKMCAQAAHASMKVFFDRMSTIADNKPVFLTDECFRETIGKPIPVSVTIKQIMFSSDDPMLQWMNESFTKIVVGIKGKEEIARLGQEAARLDIPFAIIQDHGHTEFNCEHCDRYIECETKEKCDEMRVTTCIAIGPDHSEKINKITGGLKLI